nr:MAG TPA: hypothetical protein [Caudoviricetes sp.]
MIKGQSKPLKIIRSSENILKGQSNIFRRMDSVLRAKKRSIPNILKDSVVKFWT